MIRIAEYKMFLSDMIAVINNELEGEKLSGKVILSASESSFTKKLTEQEGIVLGGSYPTADAQNANSDDMNEHFPCLLFVLKKLDLSMTSEDDEVTFYDHIGDIITAVKYYISGGNLDLCTSRGWNIDGTIHTEWEYNYNGFYGASISFNLE